MEGPESNYLATLVPEEPSPVEMWVPAARYAPEVAPILETEPEPKPIRSEPIAESIPPEPILEGEASDPPLPLSEAEIQATESDQEPQASLGNVAALLSDEAAAFWEVDHYLYPSLCDRLLQIRLLSPRGRQAQASRRRGLESARDHRRGTRRGTHHARHLPGPRRGPLGPASRPGGLRFRAAAVGPNAGAGGLQWLAKRGFGLAIAGRR